MLFASPEAALAHRLDEYLQASRIDVDRNQVRVEIDLTPGIEVAGPVMARIDSDHDGQISREEGNAYARDVLGSTSLALDGRTLEMILLDAHFPTPAELVAGIGVIRLNTAAQLTGVAPGRYELFYRNNHQPEISVYLANALVPSDTAIHISGQRRDYAQRELGIDYRVTESNNSHSVWLIAGLVVVGLGGVESLRRRKA